MSEYTEAYFDECMELKAEIKRLRAEIECLRQSRAQIRAEMREECARVAESCYLDLPYGKAVADAIRALKDKR